MSVFDIRSGFTAFPTQNDETRLHLLLCRLCHGPPACASPSCRTGAGPSRLASRICRSGNTGVHEDEQQAATETDAVQLCYLLRDEGRFRVCGGNGTLAGPGRGGGMLRKESVLL